MGNPSEEHIEMLWKRVKAPLDVSDGIIPTRLYPHKGDVHKENMLALQRLQGELRTFNAQDKGIEKVIESLNEHCPALSVIQLKVNAQVVLLRNLDFSKGLVNGSRGVVTDFIMGDATMPYVPVVTFANGEKLVVTQQEWKVEQGKQVLASRRQIPLALCWATTIHKSMGQTLTKVQTRVASAFAYGQVYVSLSRCTSLEGVYLLDFDPRKIMANPKVVDFYQRIDAILP
jgi:ATP-dependent DNA helicase PIF1